jgi:hypothetical protein
MSDERFPIDWDRWTRDWTVWLRRHPELEPARSAIPGKNFLADEVLGTFKVRRGTVELSAVTFPNLEERDAATGRLLDHHVRMVGLTWVKEGGPRENVVVGSFAELETALGLRS